MKHDNPLFLGLDSSTQSLKAVVIDRDLRVVGESAVNFDADLPGFKTRGGVHIQPDGVTVTSPALMWVAAADLLFDRMKKDGVEFGRIAAVSGSGQQHGSVWLNKTAREALRGMKHELTLREQLKDIFSVQDSPIWMDSSTGRECKALETALGGAQAVADLTGSRAYERFTGNQIAKIRRINPNAYDATAHIGLVSSFMASLLVGDFVSIDTSDGSGMNLMNIRSRQWDAKALNQTAPGLDSKLGPLAPGHAVAGKIHGYFGRRYGFKPDCAVIVFSGDNPCSLAGLRLQKAGDVAVSLGTSDTMFGSSSEAHPSGAEGHVFASPIDPNGFMIMVVRKNGSLTREKVRDACAGKSWDAFNAALKNTSPGNSGNIGIHVDVPEITPPLMKTGVFRRDGQNRNVKTFAPETEIRAAVEGQFMCLRIHGGKIGLKPSGVLATGGASANSELIKVISNVFGTPVFTGKVANSAALGAAYRALHGMACTEKKQFVPFADVLAGATPFEKAADPDRAAHATYTALLQRYEQFENEIAAG